MILPFSRTEFLQVFAAYNAAIWPMQFIAAGLGLLAVMLLFWRPKWADRAIAAVLCTFWLAMAIGYHWTYFSTINDAAHVFGALFALAALVFLVEGVIRGRMKFAFIPGFRAWLATALVTYSFVVYPLLGLLVTHPYPQTPLFGVAPCPTTIFTLGLLLLVRHPRPWVPALIPLLWSVIGGSAAFLLDVPQDFGLIAAAILWVVGSLGSRLSRQVLTVRRHGERSKITVIQVNKGVAMSDEFAVAERDFPAGATDAEFLRFFVNFAILAPSGHNTQPWLFKIRERSLDLLADRTRALAVVDPLDRALTISCGAALEHLLVAAHRFGRDLAIDELPSSDPDLLARVRLAGDVTPSADDLAMFQAIQNRRTTRTRYDDRVVAVELRDACRELAAARGAELTLVEQETRRAEIADLVAEGDRIQFGDPRFRRELAAWVHSRRAATRDGMSGESFGMPDILSSVGALIIRTFDLGNGVAASDREKIVEGSPLLAILSTESDAPGGWLATGRALSRVLLKLTASGATAAFLNQPIEVEQLRPRLRDVIGTTGVPQLLMRFGYGETVQQSVRRPIQDVLI